MRTFIKRALWGTLLAGGITLLGATVANAAETTGEDGLLSGTQAIIDVNLPINISGTSLSLIGDSSSQHASAPAPAPAPATAVTNGESGAVSGTQALVSANVPITAAGNSIAVLGDSSSTDASVPAPAPSSAPATTAATSGEDGLLSGTQGLVSVTAPVTIGGNAISLIGDSSSEGTTAAPTTPGGWAPVAEVSTDGEDSILGGTQVVAPVAAPVGVVGNAISVIGDSNSEGAGTTPSGGTTGGSTYSPGGGTDGTDSILGGTQVVAPIAVPVTAVGNAASVIGDSDSADAGTAPGTRTTGSSSDPITGGEDSILGGTQVVAPIAVPVTAGGNAVSVVGDSSSSGAVASPGTATGPGTTATTSGLGSILGGAQVLEPMSLPITIGGNATSVIGASTTDGPGGPTDPTDPTDPTEPTDPTDPTNPTDPGDGTTGGGSKAITGSAAASADTELAATGGPGVFPVLLMGLLLLAAGVIARASRRRSA